MGLVFDQKVIGSRMGTALKPYSGPKLDLTEKAFNQFMEERLNEIVNNYGSHWPEFACTDTCCMIVNDLRKVFKGRFRVKNGYFQHPKLVKCRSYQTPKAGHTWIVHESGKILDPTIGQFSPAVPKRPSYRLFHKRAKEQKLYDNHPGKDIGRGFYYQGAYLW
jgi:hypothetical protein